MDTNWLVITAGVAAAAAGLYLLIARRRAGFDGWARAGAGVIFLAGAVVAPQVLQPTGTFPGLLAFSVVASAAVGCLIAVSTIRSTSQSLLAFAAGASCVAGVLLFSGDVLVPALVLLIASAPAGAGSRLRSRANPAQGPRQERRDEKPHEPLWGCLAWAALVLGLLRGVCAGGPGAQALLHNQLVVGSIVTATGALTLMVRRDVLWSVMGIGGATLGLVLLLSAYGRVHNKTGADVLAMVILCGTAAHAAALLWLDAHREIGGADRSLAAGPGA
jgi:hypothetical protein